jgi:hypothetical protein
MTKNSWLMSKTHYGTRKWTQPRTALVEVFGPVVKQARDERFNLKETLIHIAICTEWVHTWAYKLVCFPFRTQMFSLCFRIHNYESCHKISYLLTYGTEPFLRSCELCSHSGTSQHFKKPEGSLPCSQVPSTGPYPEPDLSSPCHLILSL